MRAGLVARPRYRNHQIVQSLAASPKIRHFVAVAERIAAKTGVIKSAGALAAYLVNRTSKSTKTRLADWQDGVIEVACLAKSDPRLRFHTPMITMA